MANAIPVHDYGTNPVNGYANPDTGYGLVDAYHTLLDVSLEKRMLLWGHGGVVETTANSQEWNFYLTSTVQRLVVVMCYEDDEGEENDGDALKDDLDLTLAAPDGTEFNFTLPAGVTAESPLEKIVVNSPSVFGTGEWTATITGAEWNELLNPSEFQRYTIIATAYYIDPYSPSISLATPATIDVEPEEVFSVGATITNLNGLTAAGITAELTGDEAFGGDIGVTKFVGNIVGCGSSKQVEFTGIVAPEEGGSYDLVLTASGVNRGLADVIQQIQVRVAGGAPLGSCPKVIATWPAHGGPMVARDIDVHIRFSEPMDSSSLNESTIQVVGSGSDWHDGIFSYDEGTYTLTFLPYVDFALGETVSVTVSRDVLSDRGVPMASDYQFTFETITTTPTPISVSGTLSEDTTWTSGNVYLVTSDLTVPTGVTLTIEPGVVVKFNAVDAASSQHRYRHDLIVAGTLDLQGTSGQKVVFTSSRDDEYGGDSNGDGATSGPGTGNWGAIKYTNPDNVLHDAIIRYGGIGHTYHYLGYQDYDTQMVWVAGSGSATLEIRGCVIENAYDKAIYAESAHTPWVHDNTISGSPQAIVGTAATVEDNDISDAGSYAINLSGISTVEGNTISGGGTGIRVSGGSIQDNTITGGSGMGIYLTGSGAATISDNTITGDSGWGIYLTGSGAPTISGNVVTNKDYPIYQGPGDPIYSGNVFSDNTHMMIGVGGTLSQDVTWDDVQGLGHLYLVTSDVTIPAGLTLTIDAGVVVKFQAVDAASGQHRYRHDLIVAGTLDLQSTPGQEVVFTSSRDDEYGGDSNADGAASAPSVGNWGAIKYTNPDNVLHDAIIRYGGIGRTYHYLGHQDYDTQMVWVAGSGSAMLEIRGCVIENVYDKAIYAESALTPWVHDNTISGSPQGVVGTVATVEDNSINEASSYAINLSSSSTVEGNVISGGGTGIRVFGGSIQDNTISGGSGWGIYLTGSVAATISGNTVTGKDYPIYQGPGDPVYSGNVYSDNANTVIGVGGTISQDVLWDDVEGLGYPYLVMSDVTVSAGQTLTIDPGVIVKFQAVDAASGQNRYRHDLIVAGTLDLQSTPGQEVVFTSSRDDEYGGDSNGDGAASAPSAGNWGAIKYTNPDNVLHDAIIRYGGIGHTYHYLGYQVYDTQMVWVAGSGSATLEIRGCVIENVYDKAIYAESAHTPWVHDNTISGSPQGVVGTVATVQNNDISGAGSYAINLSGVSTVEGNTITGGGTGIRVSGGSIQDNTIGGGSGWGIYLTGTGGATISGNTVTGKDYPIYQGPGDPVYSGNLYSDNANTVIGVGGTIGQDVLWDDVEGLGYPYLVMSDVTVSAGQTLTIDPGVIVKFQAVDAASGQNRYRHDLIVAGTLDLQSTPGQEVVFTSSRDDEYGGDSNGDGAVSAPSAGNWGAIKYTNPDNVLHDAIIRYGGIGYTYHYLGYQVYDPQMVWVAGSGSATLEIRDCAIENVYDKAIYAESAHTPWVHDNTISGSPQGVVGTVATVQNNDVSGAGSYAINLSGVSTVEGNTISGGGTGIRVDGGSIQDNIITGGSNTGIYVTGSGAATISDNTITGGSGWGIYLTGSGAPAISSNAVTNKDYPIYQGSGNPVYSGNVFSNNTHMVIGAGGTLSRDVTWEEVPGLGHVYLVTSDVTVPTGQTLTIDAGVVVKFNAVDAGGSGQYRYRYDLIVAGILNLQGTTESPVIFTSSRDDVYGGDTNADGGGSLPARGNWGAIQYTNMDNVLHHAVIRYGGVGHTYHYTNYYYDTQMVWVRNSVFVIIRDCIIEEAYDKAVYLNTSADTPIMMRNNWIASCPKGVQVADASDAIILTSTFSDCTNAGVRVEGSALVDVHKCNLLASNSYGIYNAGIVPVDGTYNWWGDSSGPSGEGTGNGCAVSTSVSYDPWEGELMTPGLQGPAITSTPNLAAEFGLPYEYDADGCASATGTGTLVWSKRRGPDEFQIDSATGCISWTPAQPGAVVISIEVIDDVSIDVQSFQVMVAGTGGDDAAPCVASFSYTDLGGEAGVWDAELTVSFTENVQVSWIDVAILDSGDNVVPFDSLAYHLPTYTLTILASDLNEGESYRLVLADTITDDARNPLDGEFDGSFPSGDGERGGDFVAGFSKTVLRSGDLDGDGDVDLDDYAGFVLCLAGPEVSAPGGGCTQEQFDMADVDGDGDVDLFDLAVFQEYFTGAK
ncbi:MAG: right-handed parallel beta-helix repeat-containing protein [Phycisphaerae bacterium]|nr:right-handed parallel beta-helix repeat-containing protein [Phycisphaerae bacterium]